MDYGIKKMISLIEKIEYTMNYPEDETVLRNMFQPSEWEVLLAMKAYKECLREYTQVTTGEKESMESQLERLDAEKEAILYLREKMLVQLDVLLEVGTVASWCDILVWYRFVIQEKLATRFWEFYILKIVLDIFIEECNKGVEASGLGFHSIKELNEIYYRTVFLLRRIEYELEPIDEIRAYVGEKKLSSIFVLGVLKEAQIYDKNKVRQAIKGWCENGIK